MTSVHARPKTLHEWRQTLTRQHGQADLQDHRESHDTRCVRTTPTSYVHIVRPSTRAEPVAGWPTVSARAVNLSYRQRGSHIPDSASLVVLLYPLSLTWLDTGSYTRWTTSVRRITSRLPCSRRRSTCCSFCMPTTNSTQVVLQCFRQAAHWWTHILLSRQ
jgi:hypothetical protein